MWGTLYSLATALADMFACKSGKLGTGKGTGNAQPELSSWCSPSLLRGLQGQAIGVLSGGLGLQAKGQRWPEDTGSSGWVKAPTEVALEASALL